MPKFPTFPTLYDSMKTVTISVLRKYGYLKPNHAQSGTLTWKTNGQKTGSIGVTVNILAKSPYVELNYTCNGTPINYRVLLVSVPSNLGNGVVWYFLCARTGRRCRKLYLSNTYFFHRSAFVGCLYEKQTQSKKYRALDQTLGRYYRVDDLYDQIYKKHFKKTYAGKPTKRYLRVMTEIKKAEAIPGHQLERLLLC